MYIPLKGKMYYNFKNGDFFPIKCPVQAAFKTEFQQNQKLDFTGITQNSEIIIFIYSF